MGLRYYTNVKQTAKTGQKQTIYNRNICKTCGKPIHGGGTICGSCEKATRRKHNEGVSFRSKSNMARRN